MYRHSFGRRLGALVVIAVALVPASPAAGAGAKDKAGDRPAAVTAQTGMADAGPDGCTRPGGCCQIPPSSVGDSLSASRIEPQGGCDPSRPPRFECDASVAEAPYLRNGFIYSTGRVECNHRADSMHILLTLYLNGALYEQYLSPRIRDARTYTDTIGVPCERGDWHVTMRSSVLPYTGYEPQGTQYDDAASGRVVINC
jgi:hypothetical protein